MDLTGKRVAVVGTGASAFQFVPHIAKQASSVTVFFQRTPPWVSPQAHYLEPIEDGKHWLLQHNALPSGGSASPILVHKRGASRFRAPGARLRTGTTPWEEANDQLRAMLTEFILKNARGS